VTRSEIPLPVAYHEQRGAFRYINELAVELRGFGEENVIRLHGHPGSRKVPLRDIPSEVLLVSFDREGYGLSRRYPGRTLRHTARNVQAIADELGFKKFSLVAGSGGVPHALACAAFLPERVSSVAILSGLAPPYAEGLDWYKDMVESNVRTYQIAARVAQDQRRSNRSGLGKWQRSVRIRLHRRRTRLDTALHRDGKPCGARRPGKIHVPQGVAVRRRCRDDSRAPRQLEYGPRSGGSPRGQATRVLLES